MTPDIYFQHIQRNKKNYLTEELLGYYLKYLFYDMEIVHDKIVPKSGIRNRPDYRIEDIKLIVEFDGDSHFTSSNTILNDISKDYVYKNMGYNIIRIPYWIQLDDVVLWELFNDYLKKETTEWSFYEDIASEYPLGFIDKKAKLPSDYSELGLERYYELYNFYSQKVDKFYKYRDFTLYEKCFEYDSLLRVYNLSTLRVIDNICYISDDEIVFQGFGFVKAEDTPGIYQDIMMIKGKLI